MRIARFFLHIIGFIFSILALTFKLTLHLTMSIFSIFIMLIVKAN